MATARFTFGSALADSAESSKTALAALPDEDSVLPPSNGITLLDAKNDIFLSYIQTLALRNLEVIRNMHSLLPNSASSPISVTTSSDLHDKLVHDLVRHRVYLDKGIRPLEERLKYQIDKVLKAADDGARQALQVKTSGKTRTQPVDIDAPADDDPDELAYRPNRAALTRPEQDKSGHEEDRPKSGAYRPPRISATTMPEQQPRGKREQRVKHNATMDEYINDEMSTLPQAQPSIGSTIVAGGRRSKTAKDREIEDERREYEEMHLMRLPNEFKKELGARRREAQKQFGGEDWQGLGEGADRIANIMKRGKGDRGVLEKSRKRKETADGPRGSGVAGDAFSTRAKKVMRKLR